MPVHPTSAEFEQMFELAPVSLWLEDYSALKVLFAQWRAEGVTDLLAHVAGQPQRLQQCTAAIKVLRVNRRTLELFAASSQQELVSRLSEVFRDDMHDQVALELNHLWCGQYFFSNQTVNYALDGRRLDVQISLQVLHGHEERWDQVLVSLEDTTRRTQAVAQLALSEQHARNLFEYSPVSLWVEDFGAVKRLLDEVREQGIEAFPTFIKVHPEFVDRCMEEIRVVDVNQQTLKMFGAESKSALLGQLGMVFRDEMHDSFAEQLRDLWNGKLVQHREVVNYSLAGDLINIHMQFSVLDGHRDTWDLVLVSLVDITARKKAENYLEYLGKHDVLFTAHASWALFPIAVFAFGWALMVPVVTLLVLDLHPERRGLASSLQAFVGAVANGIVAGVVAPLVMHSAVGLATASLLMMGVGLVAWVYLHHRWPEIGRTVQ